MGLMLCNIKKRQTRLKSKIKVYKIGMAILLDNFYEECSKAYGAQNQLFLLFTKKTTTNPIKIMAQ